MAETLRRIIPNWALLAGTAPLAALFMVPLAVVLALALGAGFDGAAWLALLAHPQFWPGLFLSIFTGSMATAVALVLAILIVAQAMARPSWQRLPGLMGGFLALPHLAFGLGFGFLIMPSGLLARAIADVFTGWTSPPNWITTHDPLGLA
jgi:putative thiamine transport system permease protein